MKSVAVLGGGASALMCACFAMDNVEITIIEQNEKVGKKILATGNGRCNLTNVNMNKYSYSCNISNYLNKFTTEQTIKFFNSIGLDVYSDEEGRVYPFSNSAVSVLECLKNYLQTKKNVKFCTGKTFVGFKKEANKFKVVMQDEVLYCDEVVVALGNKADLSIFEKFNLQTKSFVPSLCALKTAKNKNLAGVRVDNVKVICKSVGFEEIGEVLFREDGISGIVIFNLSAYLARKNNFKQNIVLDFMPSISEQDLFQKLKDRAKLLKNYKINDFLTGFFIKQLNYDLLLKLKFNLEKRVEMLTDNDISSLSHLIKNYIVTTDGYLNNNQVCSGGVELNSLDDNLQAKNCKGLYFIGEVVNVDGVCGGYNLQWAWTSGKIVGENL